MVDAQLYDYKEWNTIGRVRKVWMANKFEELMDRKINIY